MRVVVLHTLDCGVGDRVAGICSEHDVTQIEGAIRKLQALQVPIVRSAAAKPSGSRQSISSRVELALWSAGDYRIAGEVQFSVKDRCVGLGEAQRIGLANEQGGDSSAAPLDVLHRALQFAIWWMPRWIRTP